MSSSVKTLVDRGLSIRARIAKDKEELRLIEEQLEQAALTGEQVDLVDEEREGKQFLAEGTKQIVPVIITADLIIGSFQKDSAHHTRISEAAKTKLLAFFRPKTVYENLFDSGKKFRSQAAEILGEDAPEFITACLSRDKHGVPKNAIKVDWDRATEAAQ
jgi:hypothetical protein